ncbi:hypothetical protein Mapa_011411 [Marchantia paleacea]|nr:hypothetical protein Mapa_011411 [Marchantia paleacea]
MAVTSLIASLSLCVCVSPNDVGLEPWGVGGRLNPYLSTPTEPMSCPTLCESASTSLCLWSAVRARA